MAVISTRVVLQVEFLQKWCLYFLEVYSCVACPVLCMVFASMCNTFADLSCCEWVNPAASWVLQELVEIKWPVFSIAVIRSPRKPYCYSFKKRVRCLAVYAGVTVHDALRCDSCVVGADEHISNWFYNKAWRRACRRLAVSVVWDITLVPVQGPRERLLDVGLSGGFVGW